MASLPVSLFVFLGAPDRALGPVVAGASARAALPREQHVWLVPVGRLSEALEQPGRAVGLTSPTPSLTDVLAAAQKEGRRAPLSRITFCVEAFSLPLMGRLGAFLPLCRDLRVVANDAPGVLLSPGAQAAVGAAQAVLPWLDRPLVRALARGAGWRRRRARGAGRPRVLHVVDSMGLGGLQRRVSQLLSAPQGVDPLLLSLEQEPAHFTVPAGRDLTPRGDPSGPWWSRLAGALALTPGPRASFSARALRVAAVVREAQPDLVVGWGHEVAALAHVGAALAGLPDARVVYSIGTLRPGVGSSGEPWIGALHGGPGAIVVNSAFLADDYADWAGVPRESITVVHNGVDPVAPDPGARERIRSGLGVDDGAVLIGAVGRLRAEKDPATLLRALAQVDAPDACCALVGAGEEEGGLRLLASELGLSARVHFVGPQRNVPDWLSAVDLFALPSRHEGFPNALLEAMAAGLPCVATASGGTPELLTEGAGLLVPPGDPAALAAAIERLLADPDLRARLGQAAAARAGSAFTLGRFVAEFEGTLLRLVQ